MLVNPHFRKPTVPCVSLTQALGSENFLHSPVVAVGYMDPGNWATDIEGGSKFGYTLLSVILISSLMAFVLHALAGKLGIVTGKDLAQACRDNYSKPTVISLWLLCELAIAATDLAKVIGAAIALNLLFGLPIIYGVMITAVDVLLILLLQNKGFRSLEIFVVVLIATIGTCFGIDLILTKPDLGSVARGYTFILLFVQSRQFGDSNSLSCRTRLIAIIPAVIVTAIYGERGTQDLLIFSQVILSLQLPFTVIPLVKPLLLNEDPGNSRGCFFLPIVNEQRFIKA